MADYVQKISAVADWPAGHGPPDKPRTFELLDTVLLVLAALWVVLDAAFILLWAMPHDLQMCLSGVVLLPLVPFVVGGPRLAFKQRQKAQWEEGMSRWECLYFCPRDEVAFLPRARSEVPLHKIPDFLYGTSLQADFVRSAVSFPDFARKRDEAKARWVHRSTSEP